MSAMLAALYKHNAWANLRLIDACAELTDEQLDASAVGTYGRLRDTLIHLFAAQERYVALLSGEENPNPLREDAPFPGFGELRERARASSDALTARAERFQADHVLRGVRRGQPYAIPASIVLIQAINHATEHRAHVATILSQQGITPPNLDGWSYGEDQPAG